jgi:subtilisin family serine protease
MRRFQLGLAGFLTVIAFLFLSISLIQPASVRGVSDDDHSPEEVIVKLANSADLPAVAAAYGLDPTPIDHFGSRPIYQLRILDGTSPDDKAEALLTDPQARVVYAEPNFESQTPESRGRVRWSVGGSSGEFAAQWAGAKIRLSLAHQTTRGAGVTVAVLDTGVDFNHPELAGHLLPGYDFVDDDPDPSEVGNREQNLAFGHGTHVAGLVALAAPDAKILPLRVLDPNGFGNNWVLAEAIEFALNPDGNPQTDDGADIINLSLSYFEKSDLIRDVMKAAICDEPGDNESGDDLPCFRPDGVGVVIVAAAGNSGDDDREYPAGFGLKGLLAVGALTQKDRPASFSNRGSWVQVAAPGDLIISTVPGGGFGVWSGTSMSSPLVAGEAALVRAARPSLRARSVAERVIETGVRLSGDLRVRVDAASAVKSSSKSKKH